MQPKLDDLKKIFHSVAHFWFKIVAIEITQTTQKCKRFVFEKKNKHLWTPESGALVLIHEVLPGVKIRSCFLRNSDRKKVFTFEKMRYTLEHFGWVF